jgi:hypothetical protein
MKRLLLVEMLLAALLLPPVQRVQTTLRLREPVVEVTPALRDSLRTQAGPVRPWGIPGPPRWREIPVRVGYGWQLMFWFWR